MNLLTSIFTVVHLVAAIAIVVLVLLQQGKGADVGAAFGSGTSNTMFGSAGGASFMTKVTTWLAIGFFAIAFGLAYTAKERAAAAGQIGIPQATVPSEVPSLGEEIPAAPEAEQGDDIPQL